MSKKSKKTKIPKVEAMAKKSESPVSTLVTSLYPAPEDVKEKIVEEVINRNRYSYWSDLDKVYEEAALGIINTLDSTLLLINNEKLIKNIEKPTEFNILVNGFKRDIDNFTNELLTIKKRHEGKIGMINNDDDYAESLEIFGLYNDFFEKFKALTFSTVISITEQATDAIQRARVSNIEGVTQ